MCLQRCAIDEACRTGYACLPIFLTSSYGTQVDPRLAYNTGASYHPAAAWLLLQPVTLLFTTADGCTLSLLRRASCCSSLCLCLH